MYYFIQLMNLVVRRFGLFLKTFFIFYVRALSTQFKIMYRQRVVWHFDAHPAIAFYIFQVAVSGPLLCDDYSQLYCDAHKCVEPGQMCDGTPYCEDGRDEAPGLCDLL